MQKKYELLPVAHFSFYDPLMQVQNNVPAYRIRALIDIPRHGVRAGELGGFVSGKRCLSQEDDAWIGGEAYVSTSSMFGNQFASVTGNALVAGKAVVVDSRIDQMAQVTENAHVRHSVVRGHSQVMGEATVYSSELLNQQCVTGKVIIRKSKLTANASVSGNAVVGSSILKDNSSVADKAVVSSSALHGATSVSGSAQINGSHLLGEPFVAGYASINNSLISGKVDIADKVTVDKRCFIEGDSVLSGVLYVHSNSHIDNDHVHGDKRGSEYRPQAYGNAPVEVDPVRPQSPVFDYGVLPSEPELVQPSGLETSSAKARKAPSHVSALLKEKESFAKKNSLVNRLDDMISRALGTNGGTDTATSASRRKIAEEIAVEIANTTSEDDELIGLQNIIEEVEAAYKAYTTDVVKLIQYPLMTDTTVPEIENLTICLRRARRVLLTKQPEKIAPEVDRLERAFVQAENKALTARQSTFSEDKLKKISAAEKMFAIVMNEASTENEKAMGLKAGLRSLEGIIHVSDEAVGVIKAKAGLLEIEA